MGSVDCFGMLYGHRRRLDRVLQLFPKHPWKSTSREQTFKTPVPMKDIDSFNLLYGNARRRDSVLPPLSCYSRILGLLPPRTSIPSPSIPEQHEPQLPSKLTAFVSRVKKALLGKSEPQKLSEKSPCAARPPPGLVMKPQELPSKGPLGGMPSEELVVIQIIRSNHQRQHESSEPLLLHGQSKTLSSSSKIAVFTIIKESMFDVKKSENKESSTLDESQVQGLETTETHNKSGEVAGAKHRDALNVVDGGDAAADNKEDGRNCRTCSIFDAVADNSTTGQKVGSGTTNDSAEDGEEYRDSLRSDALSNKESAASQIDDGNTTNESEEDGGGRSDSLESAASSDKKHINHRIEDGGTETNNGRKGADDRDCSTADALSAKENAVSQPINEGGSANGIKGKEKDCGDHPISDALPSEGTLPEVEADPTAGKDEGDRKDHRGSSNIDVLSETSSADESDGGVAIGDRQEGWENGSNRSTPNKLSNEDNAHEGDDDDTVDDPKKKRKDSADSSTSDYVTADESIQAEDASDEVEVDAEASRILDDDSRSLPFDGRESDEKEAAMEGADDDSKNTSSNKENRTPSNSPSSSPGFQHGSNQLESASVQNEYTGNSHESSNSGSESSVDEGPWVMGVDHHGDIQAHHVSPVPFNVRQLRDFGSTPSIESGESELDDTSPLFQKPSAPVSRPARPEQASSTSSRKAGSGGLLKTKASLNVWRDGSGNANPGEKPTLRRKPGMVFKDISNTRQLLRSVQSTAIDRDPVKENKDVDQTNNNAQRIPYLQTSVPYLQPPLTTPHTGLRQHDHDSSEYIWAPGRDPVRAAHFAASLAALEGKVFPTPGTPKPLIRCARQEYEPDVLLDWPMPPLFHPKPLRPWLDERTVKNFEKQVASADGMGASTVTGPQVRSGNSAPWLGRGRETHIFSYKKKKENLAKYIASPAWTSALAGTEPQIERPSNPTPDAARYHHMDGC